MSSRNDLLIFLRGHEKERYWKQSRKMKKGFAQIKCDKLIDIYSAEACAAGMLKLKTTHAQRGCPA